MPEGTPEGAQGAPATPPAPAAAAASAPAAQAPPAAPETPPWGEDFDADKAWKLVQNLRADKDKLAARPVLDEKAQQRLAEYDKLVEASQSELDKAKSRAEQAEAAIQTANLRAVKAEVRASAGDFVHTDVPFAFMPDLTKYVTADGIDTTALKADLATVLTEHPELAKPAGSRAPAPSPAVGSSANGQPALDDQIAAAKKAGDFRQAIHLENQKLAPQTRA